MLKLALCLAGLFGRTGWVGENPGEIRARMERESAAARQSIEAAHLEFSHEYKAGVDGRRMITEDILNSNSTVEGDRTVSVEATNMQNESNFRLFNPERLSKPMGYSHVAKVMGGKMVYSAGQVAQDASGNLVGKDDFRAQVEQVFRNLKTAVEAAGGDFNSVIKLNYYCVDSVDPARISEVREVRDHYVNTKNLPVSTFVVVRRLVRPEWLIEVEAVAVVKD